MRWGQGWLLLQTLNLMRILFSRGFESHSPHKSAKNGWLNISSYKSYNWIVRTEEVANSPLAEGWCEFEPRFIRILNVGLWSYIGNDT